MERVNQDSSVALLSRPVPKEPKRISPFVEALEVLANQDVVAASKELLSCAQNLSQSSSELWQGYLAVICAIDPKKEKPELSASTTLALGRLAKRLLKDVACSVQFSAKNNPAKALSHHIRVLLAAGKSRLAKALLEPLMKQKLSLVSHQSTDLANLWVQATTESMASLHLGLDAYKQSGEFRLPWRDINHEIFDAYCLRLTELSEHAVLDAKTAKIMNDFLAHGNLAVSHREILSAKLLNYSQSQDKQAVQKHFDALSKQTNLQPLAGSIEENLKTYIEKERWLPAMGLLVRSLALDPLPVSLEAARAYIHQLVAVAHKSERSLIKQTAKSMLNNIHVRKCIANVGSWLVDSKQDKDAQQWFDFVISLKLELPPESRQAFAKLACYLTWNTLDEDDCEGMLKDAIEHTGTGYSDLVQADPELLIELARTLISRKAESNAYVWLSKPNFDDHLKSRNDLFTMAIEKLIGRDKYDDAQKALIVFEENEKVLSPLWQKLIDKVAKNAPDHLSKVLSCSPPSCTSEEVVGEALTKALQDDLETCFMLVERFPCGYRLLCERGGFPKETEEIQAKAWILLINHLTEKRSPILLEMIKQAPHEVAGGFFSSFNTLPEKQSLFFRRLIAGAAQIIQDDDDTSFFALITLRQRLEPLFTIFTLITQRFECDMALGYHLARSSHPEIFTTAVLSASDAITKLTFLANCDKGSDIMELWPMMMTNKIKIAGSLPLTPEYPGEEALIAIAPNCYTRLEAANTKQMALHIGERAPAMKAKFTIPEQTHSLSQFWTSGGACGISRAEHMTLASNLAQAGAISHIPRVRAAVETMRKNYLETGNISDDERECLYPALQLIVSYSADAKVGEMLNYCFVIAVLSESQLAQLWSTYLAKTLIQGGNAEDLVHKINILSAQLPIILQHCSPTDAEQIFPSSVEAALETLIRLTYTGPSLDYFKEAQNTFFSAMPERYFKGHGSKIDRSIDYDYSLYLMYIDKLILGITRASANECVQVIATTCVCLWEIVKNVPQKNDIDRRKVGDLVSRYIKAVCNPAWALEKMNSDYQPMAIGKKAFSEGILKHLPFNGYLELLLANGKMPKMHTFRGSKLIELYVTAIQEAAKVGSEESLEMAYHLALGADGLRESKDNHALLIPCLDALITANERHPIHLRQGDLASNGLLKLRQKWLQNQPLNSRVESHKKHVALLALTRNGYPLTQLTVVKGYYTVHTTAQWTLYAADGLFEVLKDGLETGLYTHNSALFYKHLEDSLAFYAQLHKQGETITHVNNLLEIAEAKFSTRTRRHTTLQKKWKDLLKP